MLGHLDGSVEMNTQGKRLLWGTHSWSTWGSGYSLIPQSPYTAPIKWGAIPFS